MILGIDGGGFNTNVVGPLGEDMFSSAIVDYQELDMEQQHGDDDMIVEYDGIKLMAGTLAQVERQYGGANLMGDSKNHIDAKIRILIAIHRYPTNTNQFQIVVGQPIKKHREEKEEIRDSLLGEPTITVNGVTKKFHINEVTVAMEGAGAFWAEPEEGLVRILDPGSGTVNVASFDNKKFINKSSDTFKYGMMTGKYGVAQPRPITSGIHADTKQISWERKDKVKVVGGAAEILLPFVQQHYPNAVLLKPKIKTNNAMRVVKPVFANATGFYNMGCVLYGN